MESLSSFVLFSLASATILGGARRAYRPPPSAAAAAAAAAAGAPPPESPLEITCLGALAFPVLGSVSLVTLYVLFRYLDWALVLYMACMAAGSVAWLVAPAMSQLWGEASAPGGEALSLGCSCRSPAAMATAVVSALVTLSWALYGHWLASDVIGVALCVLIISQMRLPGLKVAAVVLVGLLIYDIYWVFFSHLWWGQSLMVEVATQVGVGAWRQVPPA